MKIPRFLLDCLMTALLMVTIMIIGYKLEYSWDCAAGWLGCTLFMYLGEKRVKRRKLKDRQGALKRASDIISKNNITRI